MWWSVFALFHAAFSSGELLGRLFQRALSGRRAQLTGLVRATFLRQRAHGTPRREDPSPGALSTLTHRVPRRSPNEAFDIEHTALSVSPAAFSDKVGGQGGGCFFSSEKASEETSEE